MMAPAELIIGNLLLASLIGGLALWVGRGGRRAGVAHALWVMFFVKLITPPLVSVPLPIPTLPLGAVSGVIESSTGELPDDVLTTASPEIVLGQAHRVDLVLTSTTTDVDSAMIPASHLRESSVPTHASRSILQWIALVPWMLLLSAVWLSGFVFLAVRGLVRLVRFRRLLGQCGVDDDEATAFVGKLLQRHRPWLFAGHAPRVIRVSVQVSPMLFGFATRPMIVCPDQLWQALSPEDRKAFLAHETAHFYRRDHWVRWLEWFVSAVYWWFPGVYFGHQQLERHEEACCDALAVRMLETKPRNYAEALLRVVDFISDYEVGLPGLASGMQPTATLEERLRLLMRNELEHADSPLHRWSSGMACAAIWMVHPQMYPLDWERAYPESTVQQVAETELDVRLPATDLDDRDDEIAEIRLPETPRGFWNSPPSRTWAGFSFDISGYRLQAIAGRGVVINHPGTEPLAFADGDLTAIAEVPVTGRVVIGDERGNVRLWDLKAGMPVSLLGRHHADVRSLAVGTDGGVFSADSSGSVIRWEMQSGQMIARWTAEDLSRKEDAKSHATAQSIRLSPDGKVLAVLCGDWRQSLSTKTLHLLDSQTLAEITRRPIHSHTAVVVAVDQERWLGVCWDGTLRQVDSQQPVGVVAKQQVSALVLSQHAPLEASFESGSGDFGRLNSFQSDLDVQLPVSIDLSPKSMAGD